MPLILHGIPFNKEISALPHLWPMPTGDGDYWIWGSYHGYDDGTTNDTLQRMVSRLRGLSVGVEGQAVPRVGLPPTPNPSTGLFHLGEAAERITVYNAMGRLLFRTQGNRIDLSTWPPGVYTAVVQTAQGTGVQRLVVVR
jgi:hypothetical protein